MSERLTDERLREIADAEYWPNIHQPMRLDAISMARELLTLRAATPADALEAQLQEAQRELAWWHEQLDTPGPDGSITHEGTPYTPVRWLNLHRMRADAAEAERDWLREGLKRIAGIPDQHGVTYGSTLHDVGKLMVEAEAVLKGTTVLERLKTKPVYRASCAHCGAPIVIPPTEPFSAVCSECQGNRSE